MQKAAITTKNIKIVSITCFSIRIASNRARFSSYQVTVPSPPPNATPIASCTALISYGFTVFTAIPCTISFNAYSSCALCKGIKIYVESNPFVPELNKPTIFIGAGITIPPSAFNSANVFDFPPTSPPSSFNAAINPPTFPGAYSVTESPISTPKSRANVCPKITSSLPISVFPFTNFVKSKSDFSSAG